MKSLLLCVSIFLLVNSTYAKLPWDYEAMSVCTDIEDNRLKVIDNVFCKPAKVFTRNDLCQQLDCIHKNYYTQCDKDVAEAINRSNYNMFQGSNDRGEFDIAYDRYCYDDIDRF